MPRIIKRSNYKGSDYQGSTVLFCYHSGYHILKHGITEFQDNLGFLNRIKDHNIIIHKHAYISILSVDV